MKKIAVMTIHNALNYGAIFQAYATQEVLSKYGTVEIINYQNDHIKNVYKTFNIQLNHYFPKDLVRDLYLLKSKLSKKNKFNIFFNSKLNLTKPTNLKDADLTGYDVYVSGSDQIWNPMCTNGVSVINEDYYLVFAPLEAKRISYASSLGNYRFNSARQEEQARKLLDSYDNLAVREEDGKNYLEGILDKKVEQVLDPTLLLSKSDWIEKLGLQEKKAKDEYILVYTVPRSELLKEVITYYSKKNIKIIAIDSNLRKLGKVDKQVRDAGPEEFLDLFLNAKIIITDSFHGVCFSINFRKNFIAVSSGKLSNRMRNILGLTGLESRLVESLEGLMGLEEVSAAELERAHVLLDKYKEASFKYLNETLIG